YAQFYIEKLRDRKNNPSFSRKIRIGSSLKPAGDRHFYASSRSNLAQKTRNKLINQSISFLKVQPWWRSTCCSGSMRWGGYSEKVRSRRFTTAKRWFPTRAWRSR
ncbi:hypothetical protein U1Q18_012804, partial [Sarracenia purpurea var. burkii]